MALLFIGPELPTPTWFRANCPDLGLRSTIPCLPLHWSPALNRELDAEMALERRPPQTLQLLLNGSQLSISTLAREVLG